LKKILVLAGGFGSRLKTVVSDVPKPLAPVCGKPFLEYLIEHLVSQGAKDLVLLLHYEAALIQATFTEGLHRSGLTDFTITSIIEDRPLGTGGAIINAISAFNITESFLVVNADTWLGGGLQELSLSPPSSIAALTMKDCSRYGSLVVNHGKIERFIEKSVSQNGGLVNAGLYHLSPEIFMGYSKNTNLSLEDEIFPKLVCSNLYAVLLDVDFIDIGIPEDYFRFCSWIESGKKIEL
jgi:NDP-sugar pyrophosphorylase family protein